LILPNVAHVIFGLTSLPMMKKSVKTTNINY
jgi:hypothetical protein